MARQRVPKQTQHRGPRDGLRGHAAGHVRISKREWQGRGGFENPNLFRKADSRGVWSYWRRGD